MVNIKKIIAVAVCVLLLTGCGSSKASRISNGNSVDKVLESQAAADSEKSSSDKGTDNESASQNNSDAEDGEKTTDNSDSNTSAGDEEADKNVDIDLTVMDSDMVYATVYQLMFESKDYVGKTVKMKGTYYATWYERTAQYYHCVIIKDATACCAQGIEFIWGDGSHVYPDEYPADETEVEVTGEFEIYTEDGYEYCRLKNASLKVAE